MTQFYYQYPQPLDERRFYAVCAMGCQFLPWGSKYKNNTTVRAIGRYLRRKAMDINDLLSKRPSITALQALILAIMIRPNLDEEDGSNASWYVQYDLPKLTYRGVIIRR